MPPKLFLNPVEGTPLPCYPLEVCAELVGVDHYLETLPQVHDRFDRIARVRYETRKSSQATRKAGSKTFRFTNHLKRRSNRSRFLGAATHGNLVHWDWANPSVHCC